MVHLNRGVRLRVTDHYQHHPRGHHGFIIENIIQALDWEIFRAFWSRILVERKFKDLTSKFEFFSVRLEVTNFF